MRIKTRTIESTTTKEDNNDHIKYLVDAEKFINLAVKENPEEENRNDPGAAPDPFPDRSP